jgi:uncharacterized membrane protein YcaP (DUF421 family)
MSGLQPPNWGEVFVPDGSLLESFLRGSVVYLSLLVLFRLVLRRQGGAIGMPDVMLVVLVSECVSQSLTAQRQSVPNGIAVVAALLFWNYALDWLSARWRWLRKLLEPEPLVLVRDGRPVRENLERERISDEELATQLRMNGIDEVRRVKLATLEAEGEVSVVEGGPPRYDVEEATAKLVEAARVLRRALDWYRKQADSPNDRSSP